MTLQETLQELLSKDLLYPNVFDIMHEAVSILQPLVKSGDIQEGPACARLRTIYKDTNAAFKLYEEDEATCCDFPRLKSLHRYVAKLTHSKSPYQSGYPGVSWSKAKECWIVNWSFKGHMKYLGQSTNLKRAIAIRQEAELKYGMPKIGRQPRGDYYE